MERQQCRHDSLWHLTVTAWSPSDQSNVGLRLQAPWLMYLSHTWSTSITRIWVEYTGWIRTLVLTVFPSVHESGSGPYSPTCLTSPCRTHSWSIDLWRPRIISRLISWSFDAVYAMYITKSTRSNAWLSREQWSARSLWISEHPLKYAWMATTTTTTLCSVWHESEETVFEMQCRLAHGMFQNVPWVAVVLEAL